MYKNSLVSVIICTYNRANSLKRTLRSLAKQTLDYRDFEIIVVDDGSIDSTSKTCKTMRDDLPNLRYVSTGKHSGLAHARNLGIKESRGDCVLFLDDDCIAEEDWLECMKNALRKYRIVAGVVRSPIDNYFKLCHNISQFHPFMPCQNNGYTEFIPGANMGFCRSVLEKLCGFQTDLTTSQDMEFILRARSEGYRAFFLKDAVVTHDPERQTLSSILKYSVEHAENTIILRNRFRLLLKTPFLLRSPGWLLAAAPLIALKVTTSIYLRNLCMLKLFWTAPVVFILKLAWCFGAARGLQRYKYKKWLKTIDQRLKTLNGSK